MTERSATPWMGRGCRAGLTRRGQTIPQKRFLRLGLTATVRKGTGESSRWVRRARRGGSPPKLGSPGGSGGSPLIWLTSSPADLALLHQRSSYLVVTPYRLPTASGWGFKNRTVLALVQLLHEHGLCPPQDQGSSGPGSGVACRSPARLRRERRTHIHPMNPPRGTRPTGQRTDSQLQPKRMRN